VIEDIRLIRGQHLNLPKKIKFITEIIVQLKKKKKNNNNLIYQIHVEITFKSRLNQIDRNLPIWTPLKILI